ncbi:MAG TPA: agmatine deiminase family protein [Myxococcota bacterium]|nr:agmatine deiminase family protein [Myxococcota bacterium]
MPWRAWLCALLASTACHPHDDASARDLPREWSEASIDARTGGRYLAQQRDALRAFQQEVLRAKAPVLFPHYAEPAAVAVAIKRDFIAATARRRLDLLLAHEDGDGLRILALADGPPDDVRAALGLGDAGERLELVEAPGALPSHVTFPFIRDYAPLVVAKPDGAGFRALGLALFRGPTLNKVVDARLGVRIDRSPRMTDYKLGLSRALVDAYRASFGPLPVQELALRMDGGNVLSDGRGTCFATSILLAQNRQDRPFVDGELARVGCRRVVYLASPQRLDFVQHVDTLLYVADPENVVLSMPTRYESDRIAEFQNVRALLEQGYTVHRLPRPTASITYTNALTTGRNVYVPQYKRYAVESAKQAAVDARAREAQRAGKTELAARLLSLPVDTEKVEGGEELEEANRQALALFAKLLPGREVVPVDSDETNETLGSWHCLTHELPPL